jgi:dipeptidyl-peptidase-4
MFAFKKKLALVVLTAATLAATSPILSADQRDAAAKLLARTMFNPEFRPKTFRGGEWFGNGDSYLALEPSATPDGTDIVRYQTASGAREIFVAATRLVPPGEKKPLPIESYSFSSDGKQLLLFTNSKTVWRQNTRGD